MATKLAALCACGAVFGWFLAAGIPATHAAEGDVTPNPIQRAPARIGPSVGAGEEWIIDLRLGFASLYKTEKPFSSVVVGDPKIVEVTALTDRTMTHRAARRPGRPDSSWPPRYRKSAPESVRA